MEYRGHLQSVDCFQWGVVGLWLFGYWLSSVAVYERVNLTRIAAALGILGAATTPGLLICGQMEVAVQLSFEFFTPLDVEYREHSH